MAPFQPGHAFCRGKVICANVGGNLKVLLQTYIEYLRGLVEETKTINHHGKQVKVDLHESGPEAEMNENGLINVKP